jgi:hypothetical protein
MMILMLLQGGGEFGMEKFWRAAMLPSEEPVKASGRETLESWELRPSPPL